MSGRSRSSRANVHVVVPADTPTAMPGSTSRTAAVAMASFSAFSRLDFAAKPGSSVLRPPGRTAPPCTFWSWPCCASTSRSRRTVMSDTPSRSTSALTRTAPERRISSRIRDRRWLANMARPPRVGGALAAVRRHPASVSTGSHNFASVSSRVLRRLTDPVTRASQVNTGTGCPPGREAGLDRGEIPFSLQHNPTNGVRPAAPVDALPGLAGRTGAHLEDGLLAAAVENVAQALLDPAELVLDLGE